MEKLDTFTVVLCSIIVLTFIMFWIYVEDIKKEEAIHKHRWVEQLPSILSTLGVLGTFIGITKGLWNFNTQDLDNGIPTLLSGLKTAFFTSLCGMAGAMILNRIVSHKLDDANKESELEQMTSRIIGVMKASHERTTALLSASKDSLESIAGADIVKGIKSDIFQMKDDIEELKGITNEIRDVLSDIKGSHLSASDTLPRIEALTMTATTSISTIDNNVKGIKESTERLYDNVCDIQENVERIADKD